MQGIVVQAEALLQLGKSVAVAGTNQIQENSGATRTCFQSQSMDYLRHQ